MNMELVYEGKTKDVYKQPGSNGKLEFHFKDDATGYIDPNTGEPVFDSGYDSVVGKILGKGRVSCQFSTHVFKLLKNEVPTHYIDTIGDNVMVVEPAELLSMKKAVDAEGADDLYNMEWVYRFQNYGSLWRRHPFVKPGGSLNCLIEVYAKGRAGEPDILMRDDTILALGIMIPSELSYGKELTKQIALLLKEEFERKGLHLIDGKIELGRRKSDGKIFLVDDISPDVLRACRGGVFDEERNCKVYKSCIKTWVEGDRRKILAKNLLTPDEIAEAFGLKYGD